MYSIKPKAINKCVTSLKHCPEKNTITQQEKYSEKYYVQYENYINGYQ